ncbi:NlpC/P60 family peptidoglycan-binding protein RipD [Mycobacterium angelicum]|uniref:Inv protein n=1 Tax=Mycobacterium angelicum TaxID=470074 RepID=A0A1X0A232_MYCAN|nr:NlpC/P60 family peptidoglycan-binding protein RipD [Mycobacterium angelicum]MCV7195458.1 NlpC/P60 family peptidoglycan-binding protein RipD [Mycobacterium angelicum]ORA23786.1 inv protein [Mycobacterium angelicum]
MKRIYAFAVGLAITVAPVVAFPGIASADPVTMATDYQQAADAVIARGLAQRGVPFSWAGGGVTGPTRGTGTGINTVGFDASGLIQYAYAGAGLKLPRSSGQMYKVGQRVLPQQARKADLIFYGPEGTQSVAMYLGNGQMLEVGDVVQVSPVRTSNMAPYLVRILGAQPSQAPVQQAPLQTMPGQLTPAQTAPGLTTPAQTAPGQTAPGQTTPGLTTPAQTVPGQTAPAQTVPGLTTPAQTVPGQTAPAQTVPGQTAPAQTVPGLTAPAQTVPGQTAPAQTTPGRTLPGQQVPAQQAPLQPATTVPTR